jgi:hypothetical protein
VYVAALSAAALLPAVASRGDAYLSRAFAVSGDPAPGVPDNFKYFTLFAPQIDLFIGPNDEVLTHAALIDTSVNPPVVEAALLSGSTPADFRVVSRTGIELPGLPGVFPKLFGGPFAVGSSGVIIAGADLQGPGTTTDDNLAIFTGTNPNDLQLVMRKGGPVPDAPSDVNYRSALFPSISDAGLVTFGATLGGTGTNAANNSGFYFRRPGAGSLERLVREGDPTPDVPAQSFGQTGVVRTNGAGQMLLNTGLTGAGIIPNVNDGALWYGTLDDGFTRVMQSGTQAPGLAAGINYSTAADVTLTRDGRLAFGTTLSSSIPGQVSTSNDGAIFAGQPTALAMVVREGDSAPIPGSPNARFSGNLFFHFSSGGNLVFTSDLTGATPGAGGAIFAATSSQDVKTLAVTGRRAPGTPAGIRFQDPSGSDRGFGGAAVNSSGQVAFLASVGTNNSSLALQDALYFYDPEQGLVLVARQGGQIEYKPGEFGTITSVDIARPGNGQSFQAGTFNDNGTVVFQASFSHQTAQGTTRTDQGIFTATIPLVGDANVDKVVDFADFQALERNFLTTEATRAMGDLNGDLSVDFADFMLLYNHFGDRKGAPAIPVLPSEQAALNAFAAAHVPEPAFALCSLGAALAIGTRSRRGRPPGYN